MWKIGDERFQLRQEDPPFERPLMIVRMVRCEGGVEHYWSESDLDYVTVPGHWEDVETIARRLKDRDAAREFMVELGVGSTSRVAPRRGGQSVNSSLAAEPSQLDSAGH
jgi:hypothetical protein